MLTRISWAVRNGYEQLGSEPLVPQRLTVVMRGVVRDLFHSPSGVG